MKQISFLSAFILLFLQLSFSQNIIKPDSIIWNTDDKEKSDRFSNLESDDYIAIKPSDLIPDSTWHRKNELAETLYISADEFRVVLFDAEIIDRDQIRIAYDSALVHGTLMKQRKAREYIFETLEGKHYLTIGEHSAGKYPSTSFYYQVYENGKVIAEDLAEVDSTENIIFKIIGKTEKQISETLKKRPQVPIRTLKTKTRNIVVLISESNVADGDSVTMALNNAVYQKGSKIRLTKDGMRREFYLNDSVNTLSIYPIATGRDASATFRVTVTDAEGKVLTELTHTGNLTECYTIRLEYKKSFKEHLRTLRNKPVYVRKPAKDNGALTAGTTQAAQPEAVNNR